MSEGHRVTGRGKVHFFEELDSTNRLAREWAPAGAEHGTVIIADRQTRGRGRYDRSFISPSGGLYMTLILDPEKMGLGIGLFVTTLAAVAVAETIEELSGEKTEIKWVNDVLMRGRKVCGILAEGVTDPGTGLLSRIVLGIGVNAHAKPEAFPEELREIAGSVDPEGNISNLRDRLAEGIMEKILDRKLTQNEILSRYKRRLGMLGQRISVVRAGREPYNATALDLDGEGALIVRRDDGETEVLSTGEIHVKKIRPI